MPTIGSARFRLGFPKMGHQHDPLILNHLGIGDVDIFSLRLVSFDEDICFRVA